MSVLERVSSRSGDRTSSSNLRLAAECVQRPELLLEVAEGLGSRDVALLGDCGEVFTEVAKTSPALVAPYAVCLAALLSHKHTRVRWEAAHAVALVADLAPEVVARVLPRLMEMALRDSSVIVRDYSVDALANYARTGPEAARAVYPTLKEVLTAWEGKQAHHAWAGLTAIAQALLEHRDELVELARRDARHPRAVVQKAARSFLRATERL